MSDDELKALPTIAPSDALRERTLRRARARYVDEHAMAGRPVLRRVQRTWAELVAPGLLVGATAMYLVWAVNACSHLAAG